MSRGKGRMAITPRTIVDRIKKPGLSPGERRQAERASRSLAGRGSWASRHGGQKRSKARAKIAKRSKRRNR